MWSEIAHGIIIKRNAQSKSRTGQRNPQSVRPIYPRRFQGQKQDEPRNQCRRIHDEIECILPRSRTIILLYLQREIYEAVAQTGQKRIYQPDIRPFPLGFFSSESNIGKYDDQYEEHNSNKLCNLGVFS